jgi:hypothetical protein
VIALRGLTGNFLAMRRTAEEWRADVPGGCLRFPGERKRPSSYSFFNTNKKMDRDKISDDLHFLM